MQKKMGISNFKIHALQILDGIAKSQEDLIITKRGKPIVRIIPYRETEEQPEPGKLSHCLVFEKDIVTPLGEDIWDAAT
jgi:prevent-host-death family protein